ncbi:LacI family DNA-binding transcriptional regulator [Paenibacillus sp. P26]|nr:LacI family DNA-binding transcriptional regulator [Paenibacillus sp. P26]
MKIDDIAKIAKVSKSAVSLALNGKPGISPETRERIIGIVREAGYIPRPLIKADQVYGLGQAIRFLVIADSDIVMEHYYKRPFFAELIHFVEERCRARGYSLLFSAVDIHNYEQDLRALGEENGNHGMILLGTNLNRRQIEAIARIQPRLVVLDHYSDVLPVDFVVMNNAMGAYQAAAYLARQGHRRIGYVQSHLRMYNFDSRKLGLFQASEELDMEVSSADIFTMSTAKLTSQDGFQQRLLARIERSEPPPTALFCENDYLAISAVKSLHGIGIRVPDDISVIGFDNISESFIVTPELTTIHVDKERMAHQAVDQLIHLIEREDRVSMKTIVDTRLIERKSCRNLTGTPD